MRKKVLTVLTSTLILSSATFSQVVNNPNSALKSHETLVIQKVELNSKSTTIYLSVENRRSEGGSFCADKNIYIINPDGSRLILIKSKNIPVCPDSYKFKMVGEKLNFELTFPPLKNGTNWVDLIEDCNDNCFSFYGICLNNDMNKKLDEASSLAENGEPARASVEFIKIADSIENKESGIEGLVYMNIIELSKETGNVVRAAEWYRKLKSSALPRCDLYVKHLNSQGIIY
jgi:hypothetical protein